MQNFDLFEQARHDELEKEPPDGGREACSQLAAAHSQAGMHAVVQARRRPQPIVVEAMCANGCGGATAPRYVLTPSKAEFADSGGLQRGEDT